MLLLLQFLLHISVTTNEIHSLSIPNYNLRRLLNEEIDSASFASFGSWFQSIAPLNLKRLFRNSLFGLGSVRSVAVPVYQWPCAYNSGLAYEHRFINKRMLALKKKKKFDE